MHESLKKNYNTKNNTISLFFLLSCFCIPNFMDVYWGDIFALFLFGLLLLNGKASLPKDALVFCIFYTFILVLITINLWVIYYSNSFVSIYYLLRAARFLFWFLLLSIITKNILQFSLPFIINTIIPFVFIFHALIIFLVYFNFLGLREPIMALSSASPKLYSQVFRSSGMWGGFDSASTFMAIGIIYLITVFNKNNIIKYIYIIILASALFLTAARIGSALIFIVLLLLLFREIIKLQLKLVIKYFILFLILISILLFTYYLSDVYQLLPPQFSSTVNRMLEAINSGGSTTSTDILMTMYYFPNDEKTLLIGNSLNSFYNEQAVKSDIEYIKFIWGIGLPLASLLFIYVTIGMLYLSKKYSVNKKLYTFFIILLIMIIISSFKGEYFFAYRISTFYILIFWLSIYSLPSNNT